MSSTVEKTEIDKFSKDAAHWWDERGPFAPLHRLNPTRMKFIKQQICTHYNRDPRDLNALEGLNVLDVGCGGGLVCEPMARMGAHVTGADADPVAINVAKQHAADNGLNITYHNSAAEDLKERFDVVLALEIIEHVQNPEIFVKNCAALAKPNGLIIFSTLNRTPKSFALGIVAAEYILRWVPRGTHEWKKFIKPSELARMSRAVNIQPQTIKGLMLNPLNGNFEISDTDIDVNYFMSCTKP